LNEHAECVRDIALQVLQPRSNPHRARILARERHVPHYSDTRGVRRRAIHSGPLQPLGLHRPMEFHFES
jgi:hypothetical protein